MHQPDRQACTGKAQCRKERSVTVITTIVGNVGKDAVYKEGQSGKGFVSFSVGASVGWGDKKETLWFDVTKWNSSPKLAEMVLKGTKITVIGELSTREHNGKTYLQINAQTVDPQSRSGAGSDSQPQQPTTAGYADDLDDSVPFVSATPTLEMEIF
jgi:single-strand DNA-binding protein